MLSFSQQKDGGPEYDYIVRFYDNAVVGNRGVGNTAFLGVYKVCVGPGAVLVLPAAVCLGSCIRILQSHVAADSDHRAVIWRNVSKSALSGEG